MPARGRRRPGRRPAPRRDSPPAPAAAADEPSDAATTRLSLYLRALHRCDAEGKHMVSSEELARAAAVKAALVRKDLTRFGQFGIRGVGYEVASLRDHVTRILGLDREHAVIIVGAGNLGMALADSKGFHTGGFTTLALFDDDPEKIGGRTRGGVAILPMRALAGFARRRRVKVGVLAVPQEAAPGVLEQVARAGIRAVLNFVPATLRAPAGIYVRTVDLKIHLEGLAYRLARLGPAPPGNPGPIRRSRRRRKPGGGLRA